MRAVCFTNESARCVNDYREQRIARVLEKAGQQVVRHEGRAYYVAQVLPCRKFHKTPRIYINYTYNITGFEVKEGAVTGIYLEETGVWPWALTWSSGCSFTTTPTLTAGHDCRQRHCAV